MSKDIFQLTISLCEANPNLMPTICASKIVEDAISSILLAGNHGTELR